MQPIQSTPAECPYGATFVVQEKHSHVPLILGHSATVPLLKLCCDKDALVPPKLWPRGRGTEGYGGSPERFEEVRVGSQRLLDHPLESLLLLLGPLHPLLVRLLVGLLSSLLPFLRLPG
jgi:hypothetical protein